MRLNDSELREIARRAGIAPESCRRLLGNLSVPIQVDPFAPEPTLYNPGLRMTADTDCGKPLKTERVALISRVLQSYKNSCPQVFLWICRGDFNPRKRPENVTIARLQHATRTAGRLRAELMRSLTDKSKLA